MWLRLFLYHDIFSSFSYFVYWWFIHWCNLILEYFFAVDLEKNFCESRQSVSDRDVYHIVANPRSDLPSGRDHCNVYFTADPPIRKFYLYIKKIQIADCGVSLKIYDGDPALKTHRVSSMSEKFSLIHRRT